MLRIIPGRENYAACSPGIALSARSFGRLAVLAVLPLCLSCSADEGGVCQDEENILSPCEILGSSPRELKDRLGEPKQHRKEVEHRFGFMRWPDVNGVRVFVAIRHGEAIHVVYRFERVESFDEAEAYRIVGLIPPAAEPDWEGHRAAKRWKPFGRYDRLVVSPYAKSVLVAASPREVMWSELEERALEERDPEERDAEQRDAEERDLEAEE